MSLSTLQRNMRMTHALEKLARIEQSGALKAPHTAENFGDVRGIPGGGNAAVAAIVALEDAQREYDSHGGFAPASVIRRLRVARATRAQYAEYGDTFRGH